MKRKWLLLLLLLLIMMYPSTALAVGSGEMMVEDSAAFSDANVSLQKDDFVKPITRTFSTGASTSTEDTLLNTRQTVDLETRQEMCAGEIVEAMRDYQNTVGVNILQYALTPDEVKEVYATIRNEYPEFFYISPRYSYYYYDVDKETYPTWDCDRLVEEFYPYFTWYVDDTRYEPDVNEIAKAKKDVAYAVDQYKKILHLDELSYAGKLLMVHDYMLGLCNYDDDAFSSYSENGSILDKYVHSYDIYGVLVDKKGVCSAYQLAYQYLLEQVGITDVTYAYQDNHIWNVVKMGNNWYHVDLTYDDAVPYGSSLHTAFLESDKAITKLNGEYNCSVSCTDTTYDSYYWDSVHANFYYLGDGKYLYTNIDAANGHCMMDFYGAYSNYKIYTTTDVLTEGTVNEDILTPYYFNIDGFEFYESTFKKYDNPYPSNLHGKETVENYRGFTQEYKDYKWLLAMCRDDSLLKDGYNTLISAHSGITIYDGQVYISSTQSKIMSCQETDNWKNRDYQVFNDIYTYEGMLSVPTESARYVGLDETQDDIMNVTLYLGETIELPITVIPSYNTTGWGWSWYETPFDDEYENMSEYMKQSLMKRYIQIEQKADKLLVTCTNEEVLDLRVPYSPNIVAGITVGVDGIYSVYEERGRYETRLRFEVKKREEESTTQEEPTTSDTGAGDDVNTGGEIPTDPGITTPGTTEDLVSQDTTTTETTKPSVTSKKMTYNKKIKKPTIQSVKYKKSGKKVIVKMKKVNKKYKYQCQISKSKKFKKVYKAKTFSKTSYTFKKMKKGTYYVRVRLIKNNQYGKWSKVKKVKVK